MGALGVGAEGGARISLFVLFRCYSVTKSWKPLLEGDFRRNRICNAAFRLRYKHHRPRLLLRDLRSLRRKKPQQQNSSRPAGTRSVTRSVTDDLLRQSESGWVHPPPNKEHRPFLGRRSGSSNSVPFIPQPCPPRPEPSLRPGCPRLAKVSWRCFPEGPVQSQHGLIIALWCNFMFIYFVTWCNINNRTCAL